MTVQQLFIQAITQRDPSRIAALIDTEGAVEARNEQGLSAVLLALYYQDRELAREIARRRQNLDAYELAALGQTQELAEHLGENPEAVHRRSSDGFTPLHYACFFGPPQTVDLIIEKDADLEAVADNKMKVRPLHSAVASGSPEKVRRLLEAGANPNSQQQQGYTPLMGASSAGRKEIVHLLLESGADTRLASDEGQTALDLAREKNQMDVLRILKSYSR